MRVSRDELSQFGRRVPPAPAPIEPVLAPREEARLIARYEGGDAAVWARRRRVLTLLRRPATPEGADAELVALLAAAGALPLERREDRREARARLHAIGSLTDPPPEVRRLFDDLRLTPGDGPAFAEALLPHDRDIGPFGESGVGFVG